MFSDTKTSASTTKRIVTAQEVNVRQKKQTVSHSSVTPRKDQKTKSTFFFGFVLRVTTMNVQQQNGKAKQTTTNMHREWQIVASRQQPDIYLLFLLCLSWLSWRSAMWRRLRPSVLPTWMRTPPPQKNPSKQHPPSASPPTPSSFFFFLPQNSANTKTGIQNIHQEMKKQNISTKRTNQMSPKLISIFLCRQRYFIKCPVQLDIVYQVKLTNKWFHFSHEKENVLGQDIRSATDPYFKSNRLLASGVVREKHLPDPIK